MSLTVALIVIAVATVLAVAGMLFLRTRAPEGSWFRTQDHSAGMLGVVGTVFAILLGFIILFAFDSHSSARTAASTEAGTIVDAYEDAEVFGTAGVALRGDLLCYGRAVVHDGWEQLRKARPSAIVESWTIRLNRATNALPVTTMQRQAAYANLLDARNARDTARRVRLQESGHTIPTIVWVAVLLACLAPLVVVALFADPRESKVAQGVLAGTIAALTTAAFMAVVALDDPFSGGEASIQPTAMRYTLGVTETAYRASGAPVLPCDVRGLPRGGF
jgi:hypothetical protein